MCLFNSTVLISQCSPNHPPINTHTMLHATTPSIDDGSTGGAVGYTRHGPPPGVTSDAQSKRRRVENDLSSVRGQVGS